MQNSNKNLWVALIVVAIIAIGGYMFPSVSADLGKASGVSHFQLESFLQGITGGQRDQFSVTNGGLVTQGGTVTSTSSPTLLTASNVISSKTIVIVPNLVSGTVTLPTLASITAATPNFIPNPGDMTERTVIVSTTTTNTLVTFAGNTGMIFQLASTTNTASSATGVTSIVGAGSAKLTFMRSATSTTPNTGNIYVQVQLFK